ncbi:hypothetical protein PUR28_22245 [Streptomyces sp. BE308]|uniref:hypothetical protein n=1 Tax=Streptomyces sp. BE308 TaxID=3002529 RepID=UPI002E76C4BE|nr:hypothetical protein [Streptomyces sp. BE308]MEE1793451.1 hypothetical protein [Streptomyces sp. BE308]
MRTADAVRTRFPAAPGTPPCGTCSPTSLAHAMAGRAPTSHVAQCCGVVPTITAGLLTAGPVPIPAGVSR